MSFWPWNLNKAAKAKPKVSDDNPLPGWRLLQDRADEAEASADAAAHRAELIRRQADRDIGAEQRSEERYRKEARHWREQADTLKAAGKSQ